MTYPIWLHYYTNYTRVQSTAGLDSKILILETENSNETFKNSNRKSDYNFLVVENHKEILQNYTVKYLSESKI